MTNPVRVFVIEDHPVYSFGLTSAIERRDGLELIGSATTAEQALSELAEAPADVALLDIQLPDGDGIGRVQHLLAAGVRHVLVLSAHAEGPVVHAALVAGASGFLPKDADRAEICDAIDAVARGESYLHPSLMTEVVGEIRRSAESSSVRLSDREREILAAIAEGLSYPEIGKRLYLGAATVKTYATRAFEKLGVSDRSAAVAEAMRRGLIS